MQECICEFFFYKTSTAYSEYTNKSIVSVYDTVGNIILGKVVLRINLLILISGYFQVRLINSKETNQNVSSSSLFFQETRHRLFFKMMESDSIINVCCHGRGPKDRKLNVWKVPVRSSTFPPILITSFFLIDARPFHTLFCVT